jgi:hypothetical protein
MTAMHHHVQLILLKQSLANFLSRLALHGGLSDLCLWSSWDYRYKLQCLVPMFYVKFYHFYIYSCGYTLFGPPLPATPCFQAKPIHPLVSNFVEEKT